MTDRDLTAPEAVERLAQWIDDVFSYPTTKETAATLRALSGALEAEKARAEAAEARLNVLTAPVTFAETGQHLQCVATSVPWLDQPLAAKSLRAIWNHRLTSLE